MNYNFIDETGKKIGKIVMQENRCEHCHKFKVACGGSCQKIEKTEKISENLADNLEKILEMIIDNDNNKHKSVLDRLSFLQARLGELREILKS